jgi:tRNA-modifying protein YgfZ
MKPDNAWLDFLLAQGAQLSPDGSVGRFGPEPQASPQGPRTAALVPLLPFGVARVSGRDSKAFLQAQLTSELDDVGEQSAGFSGYCTPKGRLLATPLVLMSGPDYLLILPRALAGTLAARLTRYVLRSQVRVEDVSNAFCLLGLVGADAATVLETNGGSAPRRLLGVSPVPGALAVALPGDRLLLVCEDPEPRALWTRLAGAATVAGQDAWDLPGVRAGIASVLPETQELFLPQMIDLERHGGVSFRKGCYPGQEIVARTHYLGEIKRGRSNGPARAGDSVFAEGGGSEPVGVVANVAQLPAGGIELLAVMQRDALDRTLRLGDPAGPLAELDDAPLALPKSPENAR